MATSDDKNDTSDTTDKPKDRDIDTLLQLTTYQGMTDTEIQKVIDYRVLAATQIATQNFESSAKMEQARRTAQEIINTQKSMADAAAENLKAAQAAYEKSLTL